MLSVPAIEEQDKESRQNNSVIYHVFCKFCCSCKWKT